MKNILFVTALLTIGIIQGFTQSQTNDFKLTVSGLPLFGSSDGFESGINGIAFKPSVGYFISEKTSIDLNFSYASLNDIKVGNTNSYYHSYAFVPTIRNNFVNKETIRLFGEFGFGLGTIKYNAENASLRNSQHENLSGGISILNLGIGGNYFFHDTFGLELIIPYLSTTNITSEQSNNVYSGIGPTIGATYMIQ